MVKFENFENPHGKLTLEYFANQLKNIGIEVGFNDSGELYEFKTGDANTEVMKMPLIFKFPLANVDNVLDGLAATTTNDRIVRDVEKQIALLRKIVPLLSSDLINSLPRPQKITRDPEEDIDVNDLFIALIDHDADLANEIFELGLFDDESLFNTREKLRDILLGDLQINITIDIVYKRIDNASSQIQREIDFYTVFQEADINTFCAFKFKYVDDQKGAYDYTKFENKLTTVALTPNFFKSNRGTSLFKVVLDELYKAHSQGLLHGDLHFKNIGFILDGDGKYILLFDLVRASQFDVNKVTGSEVANKLLRELLIVGQNLLYKAQSDMLDVQTKAQVKADLDNYFVSLQSRFNISEKDINNVKDFCFRDIYYFLQLSTNIHT